jgi:hypothetical protein
VENVVVVIVVAIAVGWGLISLLRTVRRVKAAGEAPPADGACATDEGGSTTVKAGCGCSAAESCPVAEKCPAPEPATTEKSSSRAG